MLTNDYNIIGKAKLKNHFHHSRKKKTDLQKPPYVYIYIGTGTIIYIVYSTVRKRMFIRVAVRPISITVY